MPIAGIKVLVIGKFFPLPYEVKHIPGSANILGAIATFQPDIILTSDFMPGPLLLSAFETRKKWINVDPKATAAQITQSIEGCYAFNLWNEHPHQKNNPLISVYTGTYNTGDYLRDTYQSLREQTYTNWEWVVIDDASTDGTWERLCEMAKEDVRVRPFQNAKNAGKVGNVKSIATRLSNGEYVVELDHDDLLTDFALKEIKDAFEADPEVGFVYSNSANFFENGTFHKFNDDFWKPRYRETEYRGKKWLECINPDIYDSFGSHYTQLFSFFLTVGPNHVRAFRAKTLTELGGYNPNLPVADDWDLYARFFLRSKCKHIDKMLYLYRFRDNWANTTFTKNKAIQDHLQLGRNHYAKEFSDYNDKRLAALSAPADTDKVAFVVASRNEEDAKNIFVYLKDQDVFSAVGYKSIFEAYEAGRLHFKDRNRIVYIHDDVDITNVLGFMNAVAVLPKGLHGPCGSAASDALDKGPWWECPPLVGEYVQSLEDGTLKPVAFSDNTPKEATWLDGFCLIAVDQSWSWKVIGDPPLWHGYDWLACKRTREAGDKCFTLAQPRMPFLIHAGYGRMEGYQEAMAILRKKLDASDISFVVLQVDGDSPFTEKCLRSIREYTADAEIVLVANGCDVSAASANMANIFVPLEINLGFAAGCNVGASKATRQIVCFLNDDAEFTDHTPHRLVSAITHAHPIVAPYSNRAKYPQGDIPSEKTPGDDVYPEMVVGLCMMMPKALFREVGGFDPRFLTWEDDDFCIRAKKLGYGCKVVGGTWVKHERHASFKALNIPVERVMLENQKRYEKKNPKIKVVAISKNEESCIKGFFEQFSSITKDFCLLDTGSTDNTVKMAREVGVKVETGPFEDFSQARNLALEKFSRDADWIIMLDPDERLDKHTIKHLPETLFSTRHDVLMAPLEALSPDGSRRRFVPKAFCFKAQPYIRWIFRVHEKLIGANMPALVNNAVITHVLSLHDTKRRSGSEAMYSKLMIDEPYFNDAKYREEMREAFPILDYDRMDHPEIKKVVVGPLISVIIPTCNRQELLTKSIKSVEDQDYHNIYLIVIGDNDEALKYQNRYSDEWRKHVNLPHNHGAGGAVPRNYGLMLAHGDYIAYLDDDNEWLPNHLSSLYEKLRQEKASFAFSSMLVEGKELKFTKLEQGGIDTSCVLHKKELIDKYGAWKDRVEAGYAHDWEFFSRWKDEKYACTGLATVKYNVETCGQPDFIRGLVADQK